MPVITVNIWKGKTTVEQKHRLVKEITDIISVTLDCPKEAVHIIINEQPKENWGLGGMLASEKFPDKCG